MTRCYERELSKNRKLAGTVTVHFTIQSDGRVKPGSTVTSTMNNASVENCLLTSLANLKFPPTHGDEVRVNYPFNFQPGR